MVQSRQNVSTSSSSGWAFSVTFNGSAITEASFSVNGADANRTYTDIPTIISAENTLDIYTGGTTFLRANRQRQTVSNRMIRKTSQHSVYRLVRLSTICSCVRWDKVLRKVEVMNSILSHANEETPLCINSMPHPTPSSTVILP